MIPRATYRVQFHKDFPFAAAVPLADYWASLGISHVYASPIATARAGSAHGYDVIDPSQINPELGGEEGFCMLAAALKAQGIGLILDIVPNHVAVGQGDNNWWLDVLEKGEASAFAGYFDIDWRSRDPDLDGKLIAPFLGATYGEVLPSGDLKVERRDGRIAVVAHGAHVFPVRPEDQQALAGVDLSRFDDTRALHELCERQHWRLTWWRAAGDIINWRRFFDITELAGLRTEEPEVFAAIHALPLRLYAEGLIDGVRVDHIDGLADPTAYCQQLRAALEESSKLRPADAAPGPAYVVVEKILASGEALPPGWPIDGTSGYDFLNDVSALLHDPGSAKSLGRLWHEVSGRPAAFEVEEHEARRTMIECDFAGQLDATANAFGRLASSDLATRDISVPALRRAIRWLLEGFPAYRTYGTGDGAPDTDSPIRRQAVQSATRAAGRTESDLIVTVANWLGGTGPGPVALRRDAVRRFQQLSAPIAAKAVEDTAFYRYGRLISRNDVGCDPVRLGSDGQSFLDTALARRRAYPHAMLSTATHDHKRGEDVRARLAVLSEIPTRWAAQARRWAEDIPDAVELGDAYLLHQTIIGAWPVDLRPDDAEGLHDFRTRLAQWQLKALREAKLRTSWSKPDVAYETACRSYLDRLLEPGSAFAQESSRFAMEIAPAGWAKSLAQVLLKYTLPGVPDVYQGCESWDLSLVDPDNRRPVDFVRCEALLAHPNSDWRSGGEKLTLIRDVLALRRRYSPLFDEGELHRSELNGVRSESAFSFERTLGAQRLIVVCAIRCSARCLEIGSPDPTAQWWGNTVVTLSTGEKLPVSEITGDRAIGFTIR